MLKLGVIGYGYWGPNVVRNFSIQPDCEVVAICDKNPKAAAQVLGRHPTVRSRRIPKSSCDHRRSMRSRSSLRFRRTTSSPERRWRTASMSSSRSP